MKLKFQIALFKIFFIINYLQNVYIPKVATCHHRNEEEPEAIRPTPHQAVVAMKIHTTHKVTVLEQAQSHQ